MKTKVPASVDEYINGFSDETRNILLKLRDIIRSTAPKAEEYIGYQIPAYKLHGSLVYFGGFKNHCSLFPASKNVLVQFKDELADYKTSTGTLQFSLSKPLPVTLIKKIIRSRVKENEEKASLKKNARPTK